MDDEEDFLNDPRLGTICSGSNSMGNSEKGKHLVPLYEKKNALFNIRLC